MVSWLLVKLSCVAVGGRSPGLLSWGWLLTAHFLWSLSQTSTSESLQKSGHSHQDFQKETAAFLQQERPQRASSTTVLVTRVSCLGPHTSNSPPCILLPNFKVKTSTLPFLGGREGPQQTCLPSAVGGKPFPEGTESKWYLRPGEENGRMSASLFLDLESSLVVDWHHYLYY